MAVESTGAGTGTGTTDPRLLGELAELLRQATGEDGEWAARITPDATLEGDLSMDSLEVTALGELLRERWGERIDLPAFLAGLDIDQIIGLTVAGLGAYAAPRRRDGDGRNGDGRDAGGRAGGA